MKRSRPMPMIDADTHVDESEATWKKLEGTPYAKYIPVTIAMPPDEAKRAGYNPTNSRCWVVEGTLQNRAIRDEVNHPPRILRELEDVPGRLAHMDKMGVDVQVIFPTFFIRYNTSNAEAEWALTTTYNRWLAEKCASTNGRLRWAAVHPHRPSAAGARMGQGLPDHVLLHRAGELRASKKVPEASLWAHRVGSLLDSLYDLSVGSGKTPIAARSTESIA